MKESCLAYRCTVWHNLIRLRTTEFHDWQASMRKACEPWPAFASMHAYAHAFSPGILFFFIGSSAFLRGECAPVSLFSLILPANRT